MVKNLPAIWRPGFNPWVRKIPWRRKWLPTSAWLLGAFHELRSLGGYSPCKIYSPVRWNSYGYMDTQKCNDNIKTWMMKVIWFIVIPGNAERGIPQAVSTVVKKKFCFLKQRYTQIIFKIRCIWVENIQVIIIIFSILFEMLHNKNIFEKN